MPRYVVVHGGVHSGGKHARAFSKLEDGTPGDRCELSEADAAKVDPTLKNGIGHCLVLEAKYEAQQAGEKAKSDAIAKHEREHAEKAKGESKSDAKNPQK